jgi:hypothetical protein
VPRSVRYEILRRDEHACRYCGAKAPHVELEVDHVIPRHHGGSDDRWNLTAACVDCNRSKGAGIPNEHVIREVREAETYYLRSKGYPTQECMHCMKPIQIFDDEGFSKFPRCEPCDLAVCDAYQIGWQHGAR